MLVSVCKFLAFAVDWDGAACPCSDVTQDWTDSGQVLLSPHELSPRFVVTSTCRHKWSSSVLQTILVSTYRTTCLLPYADSLALHPSVGFHFSWTSTWSPSGLECKSVAVSLTTSRPQFWFTTRTPPSFRSDGTKHSTIANNGRMGDLHGLLVRHAKDGAPPLCRWYQLRSHT